MAIRLSVAGSGTPVPVRVGASLSIPSPPGKFAAAAVPREPAEQELRDKECVPGDIQTDPSGQWWIAPWGDEFFMQWVGAEKDQFDKFQLDLRLGLIQVHKNKTN